MTQAFCAKLLVKFLFRECFEGALFVARVFSNCVEDSMKRDSFIMDLSFS